jgi:hypothetical protein
MVCLSVHPYWGEKSNKAGRGGGISSDFNSSVCEKGNQCQLALPHSHVSKDKER